VVKVVIVSTALFRTWNWPQSSLCYVSKFSDRALGKRFQFKLHERDVTKRETLANAEGNRDPGSEKRYDNNRQDLRFDGNLQWSQLARGPTGSIERERVHVSVIEFRLRDSSANL
jgi:hypothetical protein